MNHEERVRKATERIQRDRKKRAQQWLILALGLAWIFIGILASWAIATGLRKPWEEALFMAFGSEAILTFGIVLIAMVGFFSVKIRRQQRRRK